MTNLVTGATGFLGRALVAELLRRGESVRVLARDAETARRRFPSAVEIIPGAITDSWQLRRALPGISTVYHLAGRLYHPSTPTALYREVHVEGTRRLLTACLEHQDTLKSIVHCSTTGIFGVTGPTPAAEDAPFAPTNPYEATKLEGERLALRAAEENGLPLCIARPGLVYGPGDLHLLGLFRVIQRGLFRVIAGGQACLHPIYIDDLTTALLLCAQSAATRDHAGRAYNLAGACPVSLRELGAAIAHAQGTRLPPGSLPLWLANSLADLCALIPGLRGERAPLTRSRVRFLTESRVYDCRLARTELNFVPRIDLATGLQKTVAWYRQRGLL